MIAYEALFFNVTGSLHATDYIVHQVFGSRMYLAGQCKPEDLVKLFAFLGGPHVVDALVEAVWGERANEGTEGRSFDSERRGSRAKSSIPGAWALCGDVPHNLR